VDLPSGGYLMIDYAEAMTVIDVNSGSFTGRGKGARLEDTITKTNLEAAEEVVRQLRLRDIGGIIVIDFIDMARARNRDAVLKTLRKMLDEDRTKTYVMEISPLGLVEMTRQNVTDGVREILTKTCPVCDGEGVVLSEETVAIDVARKLRELAAEKPDVEAFLIQINPRVTQLLARGPGQPLLEVESETGKHFHFEGSEGLPTDHFAVTLEGSRSEVEDRALPFREGEEVLVQINEPHMYAEDDAVAKIDGYVIAVAGAGPFIGEKRLVRIESVGRTAASGVLVDAPVNGDGAAPAGATGSGSGSGDASGDDDQRKTRRRGRRGGRGRSKAGTAAEAAEG
jgi:ribonuclease G